MILRKHLIFKKLINYRSYSNLKKDTFKNIHNTDLYDKKENALKIAIKQIESNFGRGSVMQLGSSNISQHVETISTGSLSLDIALGIGGLPKGRIVEIYGPESSGKTTLALHCIAECQKLGGTCAFIDAEHSIDPYYAKNLGVDIDKLYVSQPSSGEEALEITDTFIRSGAIDIIVIDSVAALVPRAELEGEMGDQQIALQARLMSQALRKLTSSLSKSKSILIFLNQLRQKIGVLFGNPEITSGGTALRFYASVRLDIRRKTQIKDGDKIIGNETVVKVIKNKLAPPFKIASFDMIFGHGIDRFSEILDLGMAIKIINRSGSWYSYISENINKNENNTKINETKPMGQGKSKAIFYLKENIEITKQIEKMIRTCLLPKYQENEINKEIINNNENNNVKDKYIVTTDNKT